MPGEGEAEVKVETKATPPAEVKIPDSVLRSITEEATKTAVAAASAESAKHSQRIANAVLGKSDESVDDKVLEKFVKSPSSFLTEFGGNAIEMAKAQIREEMKAEKDAAAEVTKKQTAKDAELKTAADELWTKRPDINATPENRELLNRYYVTTDSDLPEKDRVEAAVKEYDKFITKLSGKSVEDRVKAVADLGVGAGGSKETKPAMTSKDARSELFARQREAQAKKRGGAQNMSSLALRDIG